MKAVYIREFGGPESLEFRDVAEPPRPKGSEMLVHVRAAGLNRADILQRRGLYPAPEGNSQEIPGLEFAGEVLALGDAADEFSIGERVFGITAGDAQAERLLVDQGLAASIPDNLSFVEAAAVPEAFITAHDALFSQADLCNGETVLIHAVASGVGLAGLQLAKVRGATVIGTSRTDEKLARCKEFGLDIAINALNGFAEKVLDATGRVGVSVILDLVGGPYFEQNLRCVAPKGRLMLVGLTGGAKAEFDLGTALRKRLTIMGTVLRARNLAEKRAVVGEFRQTVVPLFENIRLRPCVDRIFQAEDVVNAHRYLESNESFGKVILEF